MRHAHDARHLVEALKTAERAGEEWLEWIDRHGVQPLDAFDLTVWRNGYVAGHHDGEDDAYDHVYGRTAADVAARANARRKRRREGKR